jgi:hypothetical protein
VVTATLVEVVVAVNVFVVGAWNLVMGEKSVLVANGVVVVVDVSVDTAGVSVMVITAGVSIAVSGAGVSVTLDSAGVSVTLDLLGFRSRLIPRAFL